MNDPRAFMHSLLRCMAENNASDLHIGVDVPPYVRVDGTLLPLKAPPLTRKESEELIFSLLTEEGRTTFWNVKTIDFAYSDSQYGRFRVNIYQQQGTVAAAIRRLPREIPSLESLGLPLEPVRYLCTQSHGLCLICGSVGSGKTTSLSAMINYINTTRNAHIITIEDPVEFVHTNVRSLIHQREVRRDTPDFISALRSILREDPDVVVIGEMRDVETIYAALTIAETGHLVLATLHTGDTSESVRRIVDSFPSGQEAQILAQLSSCLLGVINQSLLPRRDGKGRILATEVLITNPAIQSLVREGKIEQIYSQIQMGTTLGMQTLNQSLCNLVRSGTITRETAFSRTRLPQELKRILEN